MRRNRPGVNWLLFLVLTVVALNRASYQFRMHWISIEPDDKLLTRSVGQNAPFR